MNKFIFTLILTVFLLGCSKQELSLQDQFDTLPVEYCAASMREPVLIYEEVNYYMKTGTDLTKGGAMPSYNYCVFTVFQNSSGGNDVYGIEQVTFTPMVVFGGTEFLEYENGSWNKVTDKVLANVDKEKLKSKDPEFIQEGLESNYYIELLDDGATVQFIQYNTQEVIFELKWDGSNFNSIL